MSEGERIAQAFVAARRDAQALADYPGRRPESIAEAYAIQDHAIALRRVAVGGWKVGRINPPLDAELGTNRLAGPIFADRIVDARPGLSMPVFEGGFGAAEAEYLLRIGTAPDPAKAEYTPHEAKALIDAVHAGIEIASSPYPGINADGPLVTISDFGNNHGLVVGRAIPNWQNGDFIDWTVELLIDGEEAGRAPASEMLDGPFGAAAFLFGLAAARGIALQPGQWISSGAVTGVHIMHPGQRAVARFGGGFEVECAIEKAEA
ncbi:2-keto-4-pentenoate hydratase [Sphingomonas sp.]|uniref:2-keto-4-pentenoate hydratase n=1 Tax=Sphingomonas sp. TaxID=28214 RepID=UPI001B1D906A|nr:2-keto-4-pentenoate hydratase [Sphingomonas sp.]MBO9713248.1 2-keto-4-pentenoate hydratase [Sphingomonas sp.]